MRTQHDEPRSTNTHGPSSSFRSARSTPVGRRSPILLLHLHLLPSRHDPPRRPRLGTVGQVGRSRNAQTADRRALRLRNPLGGRKSPLSLPPSPSPARCANIPTSASRSARSATRRAVFTNKSSHLAKGEEEEVEEEEERLTPLTWTRIVRRRQRRLDLLLSLSEST